MEVLLGLGLNVGHGAYEGSTVYSQKPPTHVTLLNNRVRSKNQGMMRNIPPDRKLGSHYPPF